MFTPFGRAYDLPSYVKAVYPITSFRLTLTFILTAFLAPVEVDLQNVEAAIGHLRIHIEKGQDVVLDAVVAEIWHVF